MQRGNGNGSLTSANDAVASSLVMPRSLSANDLAEAGSREDGMVRTIADLLQSQNCLQKQVSLLHRLLEAGRLFVLNQIIWRILNAGDATADGTSLFARQTYPCEPYRQWQLSIILANVRLDKFRGFV